MPVEQEDSIERLVEQSMTQLQDLRYPVSIQGLLALVNCLPTDYKHYDKLLPRWVELWVGKNHRYCFVLYLIRFNAIFFERNISFRHLSKILLHSFLICIFNHCVFTVVAWTTMRTGIMRG